MVAAVAGSVAFAGCGSGSDYANNPRPPETLTISAAVFPGRIVVSPQRFGAGQVNLLVTNQTNRSVQLVLETSDQPGSDKAGVQQQLGPVNPQGTTSVKVNLTQGQWDLRVVDGLARVALTVGPQRPSAQNQLLEP